MAAPIKISVTDNIDAAAFIGPHLSGGSLYAMGNTATGFVKVYKSDDGGGTWAIQDDANSPPINLTAFDLGVDTSFQGTNLIFGIIWVSAFPSITLFTFSTLTNTWGAASAPGPNVVTGNENKIDPPFRIVRSASGDIYVFYAEWIGANQTIQYDVYSGAAWAGPLELVGATGTIFNYIESALEDSTGLFHIFYRKAATQAAVSASLYHITLTSGGVIGAEDLIDATLSQFPTGKPIEFDGSLVVPFYNSAALTGVWLGTPTAAPVWSFLLLNTLSWPPEVHDVGDQVPAAGSPEYGARAFAFVSGGVAYVLWQTTNGDAFNYTVNRLYFVSNFGSGWSNPILLYDENLDPGNWYVLTAAKLFVLSAAIIAGSFSAIASIDCGGEGFLSPFSLSVLISCDNPPDGIIGVPYSHFLLASGGVPPYTFAITAGALPDGLTLDPATGEISGIPTVAGTFPFTVEVTDDEDNTAEVECSITISGMLIVCDNPPVGIVGTLYVHDFPVEGGTPPYGFEIIAGSVPPGLTLDPDSGEISGIPTINGIFPFTVRVTDSEDNTAEVECSITIRKRCLLVEVA